MVLPSHPNEANDSLSTMSFNLLFVVGHVGLNCNVENGTSCPFIALRFCCNTRL